MKPIFPKAVLALAALSAAAALILPKILPAPRGFVFESELASTAAGRVQVYWDSGSGFSEPASTILPLAESPRPRLYRLALPAGAYRALRFDPIDRDGTVTMAEAAVVGPSGRSVRNLAFSEFRPLNQIQSLRQVDGRLQVVVTPGGNDPQLLLSFDPPLVLRIGWWPAVEGFLQRFADAFAFLFALYFLAQAVFPGWTPAALGRGLLSAFRPSDGRAPRWGRLALFAALFLVALGAKFRLIDRYGGDLPFWDQWDSEADFLIHPYLRGQLGFKDLVAAHSEHRILFTRLETLGLFLANNGQWDNRLEAAASAPVHLAAALLLAALALRLLPRKAAFGYVAVVAFFFSSSASAENTLVGFQSQFYFLILFSALHLGGTFLARPGSAGWWLAPLAGGAALFSMASGLLSAVAVLAVTGLRAARDRRLPPGAAWVLGANLALVVFGRLLAVDVPGHAYLRAPSLGSAALAWLYQLGWPLGTPWAAALGLLPPLALAAAYFRHRIDGPATLALLGGAAWYWLQAGAIAYVRGGVDHGYASRYFDLLAFGILVDLLILAYLTANSGGRVRLAFGTACTLGFAAAASLGLAGQNAEKTKGDLQTRPVLVAAWNAAVLGYVEHRDPAFFGKKPYSELPYPSAARLAGLLDTPEIRRILPPSVRPPVALVADRATRGFQACGPDVAAGPPREALAAWKSSRVGPGSAPARFESEPFAADHTRVGLYVAGSRGSGGEATLRLIDAQGRAHRPLGGPLELRPRWRRVNFAVPEGPTRLEATVDSGWLAFTQPFTDTVLSRFTLKAVGDWAWVVGLGGIFGLAAAAAAWVRPGAGRSSCDRPVPR